MSRLKLAPPFPLPSPSLPFQAPVGAYLNKRIVSLMVAPVVFVVVYSILPHKELRFILYVLPIFNVGTALFFFFFCC